MTVQLRLAMASVIAGTLTTATIWVQAPPASASLAKASLMATNSGGAVSSPETGSQVIHEPCEQSRQGTILSDATASLAALGSDSPLAQASVLIAGLGCLVGSSLLLKRSGH